MQDSEFKDYSNDADYKGDSYSKLDSRYWSFLAGPAYRLNDFVSLYVLAGVAYVKENETYQREWRESGDGYSRKGGYSGKDRMKSTNFAYGAGVVINPLENLSINLGYEGSKFSVDDLNYSINSFNIGVGYRF